MAKTLNWIEIDKFLYGLIHAVKDKDQLYKDAMKKFSWTLSQAEAAINPLLKRQNMLLKSHTTLTEFDNTPKNRSKR